MKIPEVNGYVYTLKPRYAVKEMPPLVVKETPRLWGGTHEFVPDPIGRGGSGVVDPSPIERFVSEDAYINKGIGTIGTVRFGEKEIGPAGGIIEQGIRDKR